MPNADKAGSPLLIIGFMFNLAGTIWLATDNHVLIGVSLVAIGLVLIVAGIATARKAQIRKPPA